MITATASAVINSNCNAAGASLHNTVTPMMDHADSPYDFHADSKGAMHNSILDQPIEMPTWVGARHRPSSVSSSGTTKSNKSKTQGVPVPDDSPNVFWKHRGTRVDPNTLKFASIEKKEAPAGGVFRVLPTIPFVPTTKNKTDANENDASPHGGDMTRDKTNWDALIRDATVAPSKQEGQGIDFFFGLLNQRNNQGIEKQDETPTKPSGVGLLEAMLDRSSHIAPTNGSATPSVASQTVGTTLSQRSRTDKRFFMMMPHEDLSVTSDNTPNHSMHGAGGTASSWSSRTSIDSSRHRQRQPRSLLKDTAKDDCSNGSIGSSASWEPCQDIWDEDQDVTVKRIEAERREAKKRTGKELWQIVRDNRRVIIGKSLRLEDIIMMSKRPWRKIPTARAFAAATSASSVATADEQTSASENDQGLNVEDELALVSLAPELSSSERLPNTSKTKKTRDKKKHRSKRNHAKAKDGESTTKSRRSKSSSRSSSDAKAKDGESTTRSRRSKSSSRSSVRNTVVISAIPSFGEEHRRRLRSVPSSKHSAICESVVSELTTKSRTSSKPSRPRRHSMTAGYVSSSKKSDKKERKSSTKRPRKERKRTSTSTKYSVASASFAMTTASTRPGASPVASLSSNRHQRKVQRGDSKRVVTEFSGSSQEISAASPVMLPPPGDDAREAFHAFLVQDKKAITDEKVLKKKNRVKLPHVDSDIDKREALKAFLNQDKEAVALEQKKKRKKKDRKTSTKDHMMCARRRNSTKTSSKPQKSSSSSGKDAVRESRRSTM